MRNNHKIKIIVLLSTLLFTPNLLAKDSEQATDDAIMQPSTLVTASATESSDKKDTKKAATVELQPFEIPLPPSAKPKKPPDSSKQNSSKDLSSSQSQTQVKSTSNAFTSQTITDGNDSEKNSTVLPPQQPTGIQYR